MGDKEREREREKEERPGFERLKERKVWNKETEGVTERER